MTEISNLSTFDDFEIVNCSIEIEAEVSCGSVVSGTTIGATRLLIISF